MNHAEINIAYNKQATDPHNLLARALGNWLSASKIRDLYDASTYRGKKAGEFHIDQATGGSYLMLVGYAIECPLKGVLVYRNVEKYWNGHNFSENEYTQDAYSHNIDEFSSMLRTQPSTNEILMIKGIQEYVVWAGGYHFAKNAGRAIHAFAQYKLEDGWPWDRDILTDHHHELSELCGKAISKIRESEFYAGFYTTKKD